VLVLNAQCARLRRLAGRTTLGKRHAAAVFLSAWCSICRCGRGMRRKLVAASRRAAWRLCRIVMPEWFRAIASGREVENLRKTVSPSLPLSFPLSFPLSLPFFLSISLSHTHTHTHTQVQRRLLHLAHGTYKCMLIWHSIVREAKAEEQKLAACNKIVHRFLNQSLSRAFFTWGSARTKREDTRRICGKIIRQSARPPSAAARFTCLLY
jgi:hypothetical protein